MNEHTHTILSLIVMVALNCASYACAQDSMYKANARKSIEESEKQAQLRTSEENKLDVLYKYMRVAEQADTSKNFQAQLSKILKADKSLEADSEGRVTVVLELRSLGRAEEVQKLVESLGGSVTRKSSFVPYMVGKIHLKKLRGLISYPWIDRIKRQVHGEVR